MDEDIFDQMVDPLHNRFTSPMNPESQHPQDGNPMELMTLMPRLWTHHEYDHFLQIQLIQTPSDQHVYEERMHKLFFHVNKTDWERHDLILSFFLMSMIQFF